MLSEIGVIYGIKESVDGSSTFLHIVFDEMFYLQIASISDV